MILRPPYPEPGPASGIDKVRLIRRSVRCFVFGLLGVVPLFGIGLAWLALVLARRVAEESNEPYRRYTKGTLAVLAGLALAAFFVVINHEEVAAFLGVFLAVIPGCLLFRDYERNERQGWNPARHLLYWGVALAQAGLILSVIIILIAIGELARP